MLSRKEKRARKFKYLFSSRIGTLLLAAGIILFLSPFFLKAYDSLFPPPPVEDELQKILTEERIQEEEAPSAPVEAGSDIDNSAADTEPEEYPDHIIPQEKTVLYIPALDVMTNLNYGVELEDLKKIPGVYPQSGYPDTGNVSIAAHRDAWFKDLDKLEEGDKIHLYYNQKIYIYSVDSVFITHSRDWSVIDPTPDPAITLTTCHPPGLGVAPYRLIARGYLQEVDEPSN